MFGIGWTEFIIIALVLLVFVGPRNLPPLFRKIGTIVAEFKSASRELRNQIDLEVDGIDSPRTLVRDIGRDLFKDLPDPYEEIRQAERNLKNAKQELTDDLKSAVTGDGADAPSDEIGNGAKDKLANSADSGVIKKSPEDASNA